MCLDTFRILSFTSIYSSLTMSAKYILIDLERVYIFNQNSTFVWLKSWKTVLFYFLSLLEYNKRMNNGNDVEHDVVLHCVLLSLLVCFFFHLFVYFDSVCVCDWRWHCLMHVQCYQNTLFFYNCMWFEKKVFNECKLPISYRKWSGKRIEMIHTIFIFKIDDSKKRIKFVDSVWHWV